jgi:uncharacterized membrane protein YqaE (UPF0057 family)
MRFHQDSVVFRHHQHIATRLRMAVVVHETAKMMMMITAIFVPPVATTIYRRTFFKEHGKEKFSINVMGNSKQKIQ